MKQGSTSVSAARWLVAVVGSVMLSFLLATLVSQYISRALEARSNEIITNAMPTIQTLSSTRGDLRRLENDVEHYGVAPASKRPELAAHILAERALVAASLTAYAEEPFFANERPLFDRARTGFMALDAQLVNYLADGDRGHSAGVHDALDAFDSQIQEIIAFNASQGQRLGREIEHMHGRTKTAEMSLDAVSVALAVVAVVLAIRQLRRAADARQVERELLELRGAKLAAQNEALGEFAGRVAHDILSPLATAALSLDLVRQLGNQPSTQHALARGSAAIARVHSLVDGLLAFSRAGGPPEVGASARCATVMADISEELRAQAAQHNITLDLAPVPDGTVACSNGVLTSLLSNLIRNAIKYMADARERHITVRVREIGERWRFEVADTGPGIPAPQQERIFEPYVQLHHGRAGIGLGLATVNRLVRAHGGTVGVVSPTAAGAGSLFWFELPKLLAA